MQPGAINEHVNVKAGGQTGMVFGPDPSTHSYCTIGGNIGNNSCGIHSVQAQLYGPGPRTSDNVEALEIVTYDGERFWVGVDEEDQLDEIIAAGGAQGSRSTSSCATCATATPTRSARATASVTDVPRRVSGYNLDELLPERGFNVARALVGTEGTCVTALQAQLKLTPGLLDRTLVIVCYDGVAEAGEHVPQIMEWKPIGLEALDHELIERPADRRHATWRRSRSCRAPATPRRPGCWSSSAPMQPPQSRERAEAFAGWLRDDLGYAEDRIAVLGGVREGGQSTDIWQIREGGLGATAFPPMDTAHWPGWEDSAVPPDRVGDYITDLKALYRKHGLKGAMYGHLGQGCIHSRINFDLRTADGVANYRAFMEEAADLVVSYGGSLSGEHGDGQQRAELLVKQYGPQMIEAMREFKRIWDPDWKMNPGKVIDAYRLDEHLKLGTSTTTRRAPTCASPTRTTTATSPTRRRAASASASAASPTPSR